MTADNIIIATGSHARLLPFIPAFNTPEGEALKNKVLTSTELLDIDHVPQTMAIIGAGVIGLELASAFETFGSKVTVIEFLKECLPSIDSDIAKRLRKTLEKRGINFNMNSGVKSIVATEDKKQAIVTFEQKGQEKKVIADIVLVATGRAANIEGLGLEIAGINCVKQGIETNEHYETNIPGVYAVGDVMVNKCLLMLQVSKVHMLLIVFLVRKIKYVLILCLQQYSLIQRLVLLVCQKILARKMVQNIS